MQVQFAKYFLLRIVFSLSILCLLFSPSSYAQSTVRRNAAINNNKSLTLKIRHSLSAQSSATSSGNAKLKTEAVVNLAPGSTISSQIGSEDGIATVDFSAGENSGTLSATGIASKSNFVFDESTSMTSEIETLDDSSSEGATVNASSNLVQESTLDVTYQDAEALSTFQQAF